MLFGTLGGPESEFHPSECGLEEDEELSVSTLESSLLDNTVP